jgi:O-antigen ligase
MMGFQKNGRIVFTAAAAFYGILLGVFYWKYVPLVAGFQIAFIFPLLLVTIATAIDIKRGLLAFIFLFPLINNLPYFFELHEPLPLAPSALVLFLFFFLGWLLHQAFSSPDPACDGGKPNEPVFTPLRLFAALVAVSALITLWRYTNFFPFWRPRVYELTTNAFGTSAGGAIMSVVFYGLTYLTGIAFFVILVRAVRSEAFVRKAFMVLGASTLISLAFGLFQHFKAPTLGNNPISVEAGLINATFKDALSFGAFLSMILPLFLGILPALKGWPRTIPALSILPAVFLLFYAGSKSALLSLIVALAALGLFALVAVVKHRRPPVKKLVPIGLALLLLTAATVFVLVSKRALIEASGRSTTLVRMGNFGPMLKERTSKAWTIAWRMVKDYPLSGLGVGSFIIESANDARAFAMDIGVPQSAENLFLQIGSELGVPGVLLFLWILWEIIRRGVKSYRHAPRSSLGRALAPAAGAGLLAFFLNAQTHSYIGSYEIQYTFWFLAAVLFTSVSAPPSADKSSTRRSPFLRIAALALVVLGGISLIWSSTHSLSLQERTRKYDLRQEFGLGPAEKTQDGMDFRWSGRSAGLTLQIENPTIVIPLLASHPDIRERPVRVRIYITTDLGTKPKLVKELWLAENRWERVPIDVLAYVGRQVLLIFETNRTWNPHKAGVSPDSRNLGLAIGKIDSGA